MKKITDQHHLEQILGFGIVGIIVLMPFHAVLTTWLASDFNHFDLFRIWKDILLVPLGLLGLWITYRRNHPEQFTKLRPLLWLIVLYSLIEIASGIWSITTHHVNASALIYGWINDLQYLAFFVIALMIATQINLKQKWRQFLIIPAIVIIAFGLLQHFVLPADFLRHFGYGPHTLPVYDTVDQKTSYIRLQSTLRGPNPLGAYLILVVVAITSSIVKFKKQRPLMILFLLAGLSVLFYSYSRSAWLGTGLAVSVFLWLCLQGSYKRWVLLAAGGLLIVAGSSVLLLRHNSRAENIFFHTDEHSHSAQSSNQKRGSALKGGLKDIWHDPLGRGPGTAGPASARNNHPARLAENYYLQIGQETGVIGLILLLCINGYVFVLLWQKRGYELSAVLLASFVGISLVNLLSHAWADDTLAIVWWGLAGIALAPYSSKVSQDDILNKKRKHYEKAKKVAAS